MDAFDHLLSLSPSTAIRPEDLAELRAAFQAMRELAGDAVRADLCWCAEERQWLRLA